MRVESAAINATHGIYAGEECSCLRCNLVRQSPYCKRQRPLPFDFASRIPCGILRAAASGHDLLLQLERKCFVLLAIDSAGLLDGIEECQKLKRQRTLCAACLARLVPENSEIFFSQRRYRA